MTITWNEPFHAPNNLDTMVLARVDGRHRAVARLCDEPIDDSDYMTCRDIAEQLIRDAAESGRVPTKVTVTTADLGRWRSRPS